MGDFWISELIQYGVSGLMCSLDIVLVIGLIICWDNLWLI